MLHVKVDRESCPACIYRTATFFGVFVIFRFVGGTCGKSADACARSQVVPARKYCVLFSVENDVLSTVGINIHSRNVHSSIAVRSTAGTRVFLKKCAFEFCRALENWFPFESC